MPYKLSPQAEIDFDEILIYGILTLNNIVVFHESQKYILRNSFYASANRFVLRNENLIRLLTNCANIWDRF